MHLCSISIQPEALTLIEIVAKWEIFVYPMGIVFKQNVQSWHASVRKPRKYFHLDHRPTLDVSLVGHAVPFQVSAAKFHKRKYINEDTTSPRHC